MHSRSISFLALTTLLLLPGTLTAQHPNTREGFWFNIGAGYGSFGCDDCGTRENGFSGQVSLGGTINKKLLLGVSSNGWTKSESGVTLTMGSLAAAAKFYPSEIGAFHLTGGLGIATLDLGIRGFGNETETGVAVLLGLGYDFRVGKNVSISPFWNGIGGSFDGGSANFGQLGVGLTWH